MDAVGLELSADDWTALATAVSALLLALLPVAEITLRARERRARRTQTEWDDHAAATGLRVVRAIKKALLTRKQGGK